MHFIGLSDPYKRAGDHRNRLQEEVFNNSHFNTSFNNDSSYLLETPVRDSDNFIGTSRDEAHVFPDQDLFLLNKKTLSNSQPPSLRIVDAVRQELDRIRRSKSA